MQFQLIMLCKIFSQINNNIIFDNFSTEMTKLDSMNWILWQLGHVLGFFLQRITQKSSIRSSANTFGVSRAFEVSMVY